MCLCIVQINCDIEKFYREAIHYRLMGDIVYSAWHEYISVYIYVCIYISVYVYISVYIKWHVYTIYIYMSPFSSEGVMSSIEIM